MSKKFKSLVAMLMMASMLFTLTACSSSSNEEGSDSAAATKVEQIKEKGKIVLGTSADYPPFEFHKQIDGEDVIVGFDVEIAKAIASELGVELEIKDMKFDGLLAALQTGKVDVVIAGMNPNEDRRKAVDFSDVYYKEVQSVITKTDNVDNIKNLDDLKGKKVGVQKGTTMESIAQEKMTESEIKALGKVTDIVLELKNDKVDAIVMEKPVAKAYIAANPDIAMTGIELEPEDTGFAVAVKKGNEDLVSSINDVLKKLSDEGKIDQFIADANILMEQE